MSSDTGATSEPAQWVRLAGENHDGSIEQFEVVAARRALALLKGNLGRKRLLDLLQDEIAEGSAFLREQVARSAGQETTGTTTLLAHGITAAQFTGPGSRRPSAVRTSCSRDTRSTTRSTQPAAA